MRVAMGYEMKGYVRALDAAADIAALARACSALGPWTADAAEAVAAADFDFAAWSEARRKERRGESAGEQAVKAYGPILMPRRLIFASLLADQFKVPLGVVINRVDSIHPKPEWWVSRGGTTAPSGRRAK